MSMLPEDAGVTATHFIVPHVTHRKLIYEFPNPFRAANWGIRDENPGDPNNVDYLLIDLLVTGDDRELYRSLVDSDGPFEVIFSENQIELAKRRAEDHGEAHHRDDERRGSPPRPRRDEL
jgi:hypothetical protein